MKYMKSTILTVVAALGLTFTGQAATQHVTVDGDHGKLAAVIQTPDNETKYPMVMILHGFTSNKEHKLLTDLADDLEKDGIASIRFDFNGHGESEGRFQDMTVWNEIEDAKKVYNYVAAMPNVTSISVAGHSQGGVVTGMLAGELGKKKIKNIVLFAPAAVLRENALTGSMFNKHVNPLDLPDTFEVLPGYAVGKEYLKTSQDLPIYEVTSQYKGKAMIVQGKEDIVVPYTYAMRYHEKLKGSQLVFIDNADHDFDNTAAEAAKIGADFLKQQFKK